MSRCPGKLFRIVLLGFLVWLSPDAGQAQSSQAMLLGRVSQEATGEPVAKALVIQRNLQTNVQSYRYTNEQGLYSFPTLQPGTYSVRVDALGFRPEERSPVELPVGARLELNFAVKGGAVPPTAPATPAAAPAGATPSKILALMYGADAAVPQAVMISLPAQATETLVATVSTLVDERKILELPLEIPRNVYTLLALQPGVTSDSATSRGLGFSVNGQRVASSNFLLDGVDNNDLLVTGPAARVSADAVKEYRMVTNSFSAEYGRSSGFIANAITRSGTNTPHGTLYGFFQHDRLNANSFINNLQGLPKEPFRQHQFGASVGGPVRRDRLFFFANFERSESFSRSQPFDVFLPSPQFVDSLFEGSMAKQLLTRFPPPQGEPIPGIGFAVRHQFTLPFPSRTNSALGRLDYSSADGKHRLSGRYAFFQDTRDDFNFSVYPDLNAPLVARGQNLVANYIRDLAGGSNELKFGFSRSSVRVLRPHPEIPTIGSGDGITLPGSEAALDYFVRDTVFHILDNYSVLKGKHALVLGFEWRPPRHESLLSPARDGLYIFNNVFSFLFDDPAFLLISLDRQTGQPVPDDDYRRFYRQREFGTFFQDNWKVTRRLTLNLGLRFEYFGGPVPRKTTNDFNFVFGNGQDIGERIANGQLETGSVFRGDRNDFAPRFGFALDLFGTGKSVLRGSYGLFYDRIFNNFWVEVRANSLTLQTLANLPGLPLQFQYTFPARDGVLPAGEVLPTATVAVDRSLRTPYSQSWFLGFQQQLTPNLLLEVNQAGSLGRKLATADVINRPFSLPLTSENLAGRYNPNQPDISYRSDQGRSDYVALQVNLNRRWSKGLQFQTSYTYGRTRDVQSDPQGRISAAAAGRTGSRRLLLIRLFQQATICCD